MAEDSRKMKFICISVRGYKDSFMAEVSGRVYGKITAKTIYELCKKLSESNIFRYVEQSSIYIDENEYGNAAAEELSHSFGITPKKYKARKLFILK